jgi:hypothetical protein
MKSSQPTQPSPEKPKRRHSFAISGAVFAGAILCCELLGIADNRTYHAPKGSCTSPFALTPTEKDAHTITSIETVSGVDTTGFRATTKLPKEAYGIEAAYRNPDHLKSDWRVSMMLKAKHGRLINTKLAIGSGSVEFGERVIARAGAAACKDMPKVDYVPLQQHAFFEATGQQPWPNPVLDLTTGLPK